MAVVDAPRGAGDDGETSDRRRTPLRSSCAQPHGCPESVRLRVLHHVPYFADLSDADLARINRRMVSLSWAEGDTVYQAGQPAEHLFVMATGHAKAYRTSADGRSVVVDLLAAGDFFGGSEMLGSPEYAETVEALGTVCVLRMDAHTFREVLTQYPSVAVRALDNVSAQLGRSRENVLQQATGTVAERVATTLLRLVDKFGEENSENVLIQLPLSRSDLAGMTGSTTESVSRVMSRLRKEGVIDSGRRWTSIVDPDRLAEVAGQG